MPIKNKKLRVFTIKKENRIIASCIGIIIDEKTKLRICEIYYKKKYHFYFLLFKIFLDKNLKKISLLEINNCHINKTSIINLFFLSFKYKYSKFLFKINPKSIFFKDKELYSHIKKHEVTYLDGDSII